MTTTLDTKTRMSIYKYPYTNRYQRKYEHKNNIKYVREDMYQYEYEHENKVSFTSLLGYVYAYCYDYKSEVEYMYKYKHDHKYVTGNVYLLRMSALKYLHTNESTCQRRYVKV